MDNDRHDDGLVHGHAWATEPARAAPRPIVIRAHDRQDEGLVHEHRWACSERGRAAHRN